MHTQLISVEAKQDGASFESVASAGELVVRRVGSLDDAVTLAGQWRCDAVLLDLDVVGEGSVSDAVQRFGELPVIAMGSGGPKQAVLSMRCGACDFLEKPFDLAAVRYRVEMALALAAVEGAAPGRPETEDEGPFGVSEPGHQVHDLVRRVARTNTTVLVRGGSGKARERVARALHRGGARSGGPFVKMRCAGVPETLLECALFGHERGALAGATHRKPGRLEVAEGGTIFVDEVSDATSAVQLRFLRLLLYREYQPLGSVTPLHADVRFIAGTDRDLEHLVKKGEFREDLFYRLNVVPIRLSPRPRVAIEDRAVIERALEQAKGVTAIRGPLIPPDEPA